MSVTFVAAAGGHAMIEDCVLLAVADSTIRRQMADGLASSGLCVHETNACGDAMKAVQREPVSVLLVDIHLPDGPCQPLLRACAALEPRAECILIASPEEMEVALTECESGRVYDVVQRRTADVGTVVRLVIRAAERRALRRQNAYLLAELRDARDELRGQAEFLVQVERLAAAGHSALAVARTAAGDAAVVEARLKAAERSGVAYGGLLEEARQASERCLSALRGLAALASDQMGEEAVDVNDVVVECCRLLQPVAETRGVRLVCALDTALPALRANPHRLHQAIAHVGLNAVEATLVGGLVRIETERLDGERPGVAVHVSDNGPGMPADVVAHLYEPFYTTRRLHQGTGLGLAATRAIVRAMHGDIRVETAAGQGTRVTLAFPAACANDPPVAHPMAA